MGAKQRARTFNSLTKHNHRSRSYPHCTPRPSPLAPRLVTGCRWAAGECPPVKSKMSRSKMLCGRRCLLSELLQQHVQTVESESFSFSHSATLRWHKKIGQIIDNGSNFFADNPLSPDQSHRVTQGGLLLSLSWLCPLGLWESLRAWFYGLPLGGGRGPRKKLPDQRRQIECQI